MRHLFECPMRWADLDMLGHVNNVTYVDYLQEARVDLMRSLLPTHPSGHEDLTEGVVVVRHEVTYVSPLGLRFRPVRVECWVTDVRAATFTLAYEVFHDDPDSPTGRVIYLRATTVLTPYVFAEERPRRLTVPERQALERYGDEAVTAPTPRIASVAREGAFHYPVQVRFSDVDLYRHVNNVTYFEYLQEARIRMIAGLVRDRDVVPPHVVVAQTDVEYRAPILLRPAPYDVWSQVVRLGTRSMTVESQIDDGERTVARARVVMVFWDREQQTSTTAPSDFRELVSAQLPAS